MNDWFVCNLRFSGGASGVFGGFYFPYVFKIIFHWFSWLFLVFHIVFHYCSLFVIILQYFVLAVLDFSLLFKILFQCFPLCLFIFLYFSLVSMRLAGSFRGFYFRGSTQRKLRTNKEHYVFLSCAQVSSGASCLFGVVQLIVTREGFQTIPFNYPSSPPKILPLSIFSVSAPDFVFGRVVGQFVGRVFRHKSLKIHLKHFWSFLQTR